MAMKRTRTDMDVEQKVELLNLYHDMGPCNKKQAAEILGISNYFLRTLLRNEQQLRKALFTNVPGKKRHRFGKDRDTEERLLHWFKRMQSSGAPLTGRILCQKAEEIAAELGRLDFRATDGWFSRWKKRNGVNLRQVHSETTSTNAAAKWQDEMQKITASYHPSLIYNAIETELYLRALPDRAYMDSDPEQSSGETRAAHGKITVLLCCSLAGDRKKLLVIGKTSNPQCFKNVKTLPVLYSSSENAQMTFEIWKNWALEWNSLLRQENKKIVLLIDPCATYCNSYWGLSHIDIRHIPTDTTSALQPCNMGMIRTLKAHFRQEMWRWIIDVIDDSNSALTGHEAAKKLTLLDAMYMLAHAWREVQEATIICCWQKAGFRNEGMKNEHDENAVFEVPPPPGLTAEEFNEWVMAEDVLEMGEPEADEPYSEEIYSDTETQAKTEVSSCGPDNVSSPLENRLEGEEEEEEDTPSNGEMRECLRRLRIGLERRGFRDMENFDVMQSEIKDFLRFQPNL